MKKLLVAGGTISMLVFVILLIRQCSQPPSDTEIRQKIVGTWTPVSLTESPLSAITDVSADGSFLTRWTTTTNEIAIHGSWRVENGVLFLTATNVVGAEGADLGSPIQRHKIVRIEENEIVSQVGADTNLVKLRRL